jgi:hypothetical protein
MVADKRFTAMKTPQSITNIRVMRIEKQYETDKGSPLACSNCICNVDGQEVRVEIDGYLMHDWEPGEPQEPIEPQVMKLVEIFIHHKINQGWSPQQSDRLVLDEKELRPIAKNQHWKPRH